MSEDTHVKIVANGHLGPFRRTYTITSEEEERSVKLIMRDFISYVVRGHRARYKKALDVLVELQKIEEKEGGQTPKVYKDRALERSDRR